MSVNRRTAYTRMKWLGWTSERLGIAAKPTDLTVTSDLSDMYLRHTSLRGLPCTYVAHRR